MSRDYIQPEKPDPAQDFPPPNVGNLTSEQIRDPRKWSNEAIFSMIRLKHESVDEMIRILKARAEANDHEAGHMLDVLTKKKAEDNVALRER